MNATESKKIINWHEEDIARSQKFIEMTKAECTHVYDNGKTAVAYTEMHGCPGPLLIGNACQVCWTWTKG